MRFTAAVIIIVLILLALHTPSNGGRDLITSARDQYQANRANLINPIKQVP